MLHDAAGVAHIKRMRMGGRIQLGAQIKRRYRWIFAGIQDRIIADVGVAILHGRHPAGIREHEDLAFLPKGKAARNIAVAAGAKGDQIDKVAEQMVKEHKIRMDRAKELIDESKTK